MTGKTHTAAGVAVSIYILSPPTIRDYVIVAASALIGSVISDVDVHTSGSYKQLMKIICCILLILTAVVSLDFGMHLGIYQQIKREISSHSGIWLPLAAVMVFLCVCYWGSNRPHRSFMHSFLAVAILGACTFFFFHKITPGFAIGMLSHIVLDMLNYKKVKILYPMKKGYALKLFQSGKTADSIILGASVVLFVWKTYVLLL